MGNLRMLTDEQKAYIRSIAYEVIDRVIEDHEVRIRNMEQKVYNGFGVSIKWLKWLTGLLYTGLMGLLFWHLRGIL